MTTSKYSRSCRTGCPNSRRDGDFLCRKCWYRLPVALRGAVWSALRQHGNFSLQHRAAMSVALDWLRDNG